MQEKIAIRKKAFNNRKKQYFEITSQFFHPLLVLLKKKKQNSKNILSLYYPSNYEVNVLSLFKLIKKNITTIGVAFSFQKYNKLPVSNLDIKLDYILTEKGLKK